MISQTSMATLSCMVGLVACVLSADNTTEGTLSTASSSSLTATSGTTTSSTDTAFTSPTDPSETSGTSGSEQVHIIEIHGEHVNDHVGRPTRTGDFNGDGLNDVALSGLNRVYIIFGRTDPPPVILVAEIVEGKGGAFIEHASEPLVVSGVGDVNGDGFADLVIGTPQSDGNQSKSGNAYVVFGRPKFVSKDLSVLLGEGAAVRFAGESAGDESGSAVSIVGDVTGDGFSDIAIANRRMPTGLIYIINGSEQLQGGSLANVGSTIAGGTIELKHELGWNYGADIVTGLGDVNGDGVGDLGVSVSLWTDGKDNLGRAYVLFGGQFGLPLAVDAAAGFHIQGTPESALGQGMSTAGDFNQDGFADVLVGAPDAYGATGAAYLILGGAGLQSIDLAEDFANVIELRNSSGLGLGWATDTATDVDQDGFSDLVLGSPCVYLLYDPKCSDATYLLYGGGELPSLDLQSLLLGGRVRQFVSVGNDGGDFDYGRFGTSVAGLGDFDGDGRGDFAVGAPSEDPSGSNSGRTYIVLGGKL